MSCRLLRLTLPIAIVSSVGCSDPTDTATKELPARVGYAFAMTFDASSKRLFLAWSVPKIDGEQPRQARRTQIEGLDTSTWKLVNSWSVDDVWVMDLGVSRNRLILAGGTGTTGVDGGTAKLWDAATGRHLQTIQLYESVDERYGPPKISRIVVTPDGNEFAALSSSDLYTYDISKPTKPRRTGRIVGRIARIALYGDCEVLMGDTKLGIVRALIAKPEDGEVVIDPDLINAFYGLASAKDVILTCDESGVKSWRGGSQKPRVIANEFKLYNYLSINSDATIAAGARDHVAYVWDLAEGKNPKKNEIRAFTFQDVIASMALSPNGNLLAVFTYDPNDNDSPRVQVFEVKSGKEVAEFKFVDRRDGS